MANQVLGFSIKLEGSEKVLRTISDLENFIVDINKALKDADVGSDTYNKLNKSLVDAKVQLRGVKKEQRDQVKAAEQLAKANNEVTKSIDAEVQAQKKQVEETKAAAGSVNALAQQLKDARVQFSALSKEERESEPGEKLLKNIQELDRELKDLTKSQRAQKEETKKTADVVKFADGSYRQLNAELVKSRREFKELSREERENAQVGGVLQARIQELDSELKDLDKTIGQNQRNVGNYESAFDGLGGAIGGGISGIAGFAFGAAGIGAAGDIIIDATQQLAELTEEFRVLRGTVEQLTGATGNELDEFTSRIRAISETFGEDTNEILQAANSLSKQLGIDFSEALTAVEEGFISGTNANGEFLDSLREYSTQAEAAGLNTAELVSILNQSATAGIYSDKGIDAVKEFGLRIREQTKPVQDALNAAFGEEFTQELFDNINSGAISTADALKLVSGELGDTTIPANKLQTVIADVFGGAGEDAGIAFLRSLENINSSFEDLDGSSSEYAKQQRRILILNQQMAESQNALTKELQGGTDEFAALSLELGGKLTTAFTLFIRNAKFVISGIVQLGSAIGKLIASIPGLGTVLKFVVGGLGELIEAFSSLRELAGRVSDTFAGVREAAIAFSENTADRFRRLSIAAEIAGKRIQLGLTLNKSRRAEINKELQALQAEQSAILSRAGNDVGNAFNLGFENALRARREVELAAAKESEKIQKELSSNLLKTVKNQNTEIDKEQQKAIKKRREKEAKEAEKLAKLIQDEELKAFDEFQKEIEDSVKNKNELLRKLDTEEIAQNNKDLAQELKDVQEFDKLELEATKKLIEEEDKLRDEQLEKDKERRQQRIDFAFDAAQTIANASFEIANIKAEQQNEQELARLNAQEALQLERVEGNAVKEERIQTEFAQKREKLERDAAKKSKERAITQALINGALAVTNALATVQPLVPAGVLAAASVAIATAAQVATISAQKFAQGGLIGGRSHANGGTMIEAERGEAIINKRSTRSFGPLLSAINEAGGGVRFQNGGIAGAPLPLPSIRGTQNDFGQLVNAIRQDVAATKQLALSVEQSVINLRVNLNTDELVSEEQKKVQLNNIRTL
jgi:hypothetical protein